jgi:hypothetical protein
MTTITLVLRDSLICWIEKMPLKPSYCNGFTKGTCNCHVCAAAEERYNETVAAVIESAPQVSNPEVICSTRLFSWFLRTEVGFDKAIIPGVPFEVSGWKVEEGKLIKTVT